MDAAGTFGSEWVPHEVYRPVRAVHLSARSAGGAQGAVVVAARGVVVPGVVVPGEVVPGLVVPGLVPRVVEVVAPVVVVAVGCMVPRSTLRGSIR